MLKNQLGQIVPTDALIALVATITISILFVTVTQSNIIAVDNQYQAELKEFFLQGE